MKKIWNKRKETVYSTERKIRKNVRKKKEKNE